MIDVSTFTSNLHDVNLIKLISFQLFLGKVMCLD